MAKTWKEEHWHCISVISNGLHDINNPWEWCKTHITCSNTFTYQMSNVSTFAVNYYFKRKEDAVQFQLVWG